MQPQNKELCFIHENFTLLWHTYNGTYTQQQKLLNFINKM